MYKPSIDDMFAGKQSRYSLVMGVAKRAREIAEDAEVNHVVLDEKPVLIAAKEFKEHKYDIIEQDIDD